MTGADGETERDAGGELRSYRIGDGFLLRRTEQFVSLPEAPARAPLRLDVDRSRLDHPRIRSLTVRVDGPAAPSLSPNPVIRLSAPPAPGPALRARLEAIVSVVRERLRYEAGASALDLDDLLGIGVGDCYEFSLLFEALATGSGLEAEIVTGLAWSPGAPTAFVPHAWNRVRADEGWVVVDPTWDRIVQDADRIPFPAGKELDAQLALRTSSLEILATDPASGE